MNKVFLITGAAGHLASFTISLLKERGHYVRGLILPFESGVDDERVTYYKGDVTRIDSMDDFFSGLEGCEVTVIHLAAIVSIDTKASPQIYKVNVEGTGNIIKMCMKHKVKRLVYVSSVHAIPEPAKRSVVSEIVHFSKNRVFGAYAKTKAEATRLVLEAVESGLDAVVVQPSGVIGPGDNGRNHISGFFRMYLSRRLPCGVTGGYDFVDVRDVAQGILSAAEKGRSGECYILSNRYVSIKELISMMGKAADRKDRTPIIPIFLAQIAAPFVELWSKIAGKRTVFTGYSLYTLKTRSLFSHDKATRELGYRPRDIYVTVSDTIGYLKRIQDFSPLK